VEPGVNGVETPWVNMVRRWVALYTRGLSVDVRDRRLLELESDVWEHLHDADEPNARRAMFGRFCVAYPPMRGGDITRSSNLVEPDKGVRR
jgi:hypothetical protein